MKEMEKFDYCINSLVKSINVLELLIKNEEMSIQEISAVTGLIKSNVHRIVNTFKALGYVDQNLENSKYYPTIKIFEMGNIIANRIPFKKIARPYIEELFDKCKETVNLAMLDGTDIIFLDKFMTNEPLRIELEVGKRVPVYCSALGKAMLAYSDRKLIDNINFEKVTTNTIASKEDFLKELESIREKGYSIDNEEYVYGLICIGAPILNSRGKAAAAISIATPKVRMDDNKKEQFIKYIKETVKKIQDKMTS